MSRTSVTLTVDELAMCREVGVARNAEHAGHPDGRVDTRRTSEQVHVDGAIGEYAFASAYGFEWSGRLLRRADWERQRSLRDVGEYMVKAVVQAHHNLIIPGDEHAAKQAPYVLALLHALPAVTFAGWVWGEEAMRPRYWKTTLPKPAYLVAQAQLRDMAELPLF